MNSERTSETWSRSRHRFFIYFFFFVVFVWFFRNLLSFWFASLPLHITRPINRLIQRRFEQKTINKRIHIWEFFFLFFFFFFFCLREILSSENMKLSTSTERELNAILVIFYVCEWKINELTCKNGVRNSSMKHPTRHSDRLPIEWFSALAKLSHETQNAKVLRRQRIPICAPRLI